MNLVLLAASADLAARLESALAQRGTTLIAAPDAAAASAATERTLPVLVVVGPDLLEEPLAAGLLADARWLPVVLVSGAEAPALELPERVRTLDPSLGEAELAARISLAAVGQRLGIEPDPELASLIGDSALHPPLEVVRGLCRHQLTVEVTLEHGSIQLGGGDVLAASSRRATGIKAFCRLVTRHGGTLRVRSIESPPREIGMGLDQLLLRALEDAQELHLDPRASLRLSQPGLHRAKGLLDYQRDLLLAAERAPTLGELFDALPWPDGLIARRLGKLVEVGLVALERSHRPTTVVTDSTCDLPAEVIRRFQLEVVPLTVCFGEQSFRDGVEIRPVDFYELLTKRPEHPTTKPPEPSDYSIPYASLLPTQDIVSVHLSGKLSLTASRASEAAAAALATEQRTGARIEVVDSQTISAGTGLLVIAAARMAERGLGAGEIAAHLRAMAPRIQTLFVVDTFDYLVRGGRVGKARATIGKWLGIKPILGVVAGEIAAVDKARGGREAHPRIIELLRARLEKDRPIIAAIAHAKAPVWADRLRGLLESRFTVHECLVTEIGPVIGTHAGPGCVGTAVFQPTDEEWALIRPLEGETDGSV